MICAAAVALASSGCAGREQGEAKEDRQTQDGKETQGSGEAQENSQAQAEASGTVPVARIEDFGRSLPLDPQITGGVLYYMDGTWDQDSGWYREASVYRQRPGEEAEEIFSLEEGEFLKYLAGTDGSVYCVYAEDPRKRWDMSIRKMDGAGNMAYDVHIFDGEEAPSDGEREMLDSFSAAAGGAADGAGRICLCSLEGRLILFGADGKYRCTGSLGWDAQERSGKSWGIAGTEDGSVYTYLCDGGTLRLKEVSMEDGRTGEETAAETGSGGSLEVCGGDGIFLWDADALWRYDVSGGTLDHLLGWGDGTVGMRGYYVDAAGDAGDGKLYILAHLAYEDVALVRVSREEAPQEEAPVVLGTTSGMERDWQELADKYNRTAPARRVEVHSYESFREFQLALARGDAPDLIDLNTQDTDALAEGGVLEDLEPFLEGSGTVGKEDLLASVLEAGKAGGKYVAVIPGYAVSAFLVKRDATDQGRWTPEEFLALAQAHPESLLVYGGSPAYYHDTVMQYAVIGDMEAYVDWEGKECFFDSDRFISLLEDISSLDTPDVDVDVKEKPASAEWEALAGGGLLAARLNAGAWGTGAAIQGNGGLSGGTYETAGYPNQAKELRFVLDPAYILGLYSGSKAKEDAWAFLEFLLSKECQDSQGYLWARTDTFEKWVNEGKVRGMDSELSREDREYIRYMADNARRTTTKWWTVLPIVIEEMNAVCRGERTAQEAAQIIQSRVTLMLW